jgi:hypothetical protein
MVTALAPPKVASAGCSGCVLRIYLQLLLLAWLNETGFGPKKKSSTIYLGPKNLDTFWCTGWAWNCQIIFRCAVPVCYNNIFIITYLLFVWPKVKYHMTLVWPELGFLNWSPVGEFQGIESKPSFLYNGYSPCPSKSGISWLFRMKH